MKKFFTLFISTITCLNFYAQTSFEKGYFINNSDDKVECFIKNLDLLYNPQKFTYKLSEESKPITATLKDVKVFEIYNVSKYERHLVEIDRSSDDFRDLSNERNPEFNSEQVFLKLLVEGKASLYQYTESNFSRFFYKNSNTEVQQLVYKSYLMKDGLTINKNQYYKQQLLNDLKCNSISENRINNLLYRKSNLTKFFISYNECVNAKYIHYNIKDSKNSNLQFNINLRVGANFLNYDLQGNKFDPKVAARVGVELEYVMGFNNNKWAFIIEPNYLYYSSTYNDTTERITGADNSATIEYSAIDLPLGIRHYMYLNKKSKFFINALLIPNFTIKSESRSIGTNVNNSLDFDGESDINYGFGLGYKYNDKFSIEFRTSTQRDLLNQFGGIESKFTNSSIILGYTLF